MVEGDDPFAYPPVCFYKKESCTSRSAEDTRIVIFPLFSSFPLIYKAFYIKKSLKKFLKNFYKFKTDHKNVIMSKPTYVAFVVLVQIVLVYKGYSGRPTYTNMTQFVVLVQKGLFYKEIFLKPT